MSRSTPSADVVVEDTTGGGEQFPHIYGPLPIDAVVDVLAAMINPAGDLVVEA